MAAAHGHVECAKLLISASGPFLHNQRALSAVIEGDSADMLSLMLAHEPRLLAGYNLSGRRSAATAKGQAKLAALLSSIIDHEALCLTVPVDGARSASRGARL